MLKKMGFPSLYVQGPGALAESGAILRDLGCQRPTVLCDDTVRKIALPALTQGLEGAGLPVSTVTFPGEICRETIAACNADVRQLRPDVVIGLGGGKAIDAAKAAASDAGVPVIVMPTVASNDAPTSRLIVVNDANHRPTEIAFLRLNPLLVLVDTKIIVKAPPRLFAAGIGDAISKSLEAHQCAASGGVNFFGTEPLATALFLADQCYAIILEKAAQAYRLVAQKRTGPEVEAVVEATVLLSGLGFENGGLSLAHSMIRGLLAVPSTANALHGEMVAFGALVQMIAEGRSAPEVNRLLSVMTAVGLPASFEDLGHTGPLSDAQLEAMVEATLAHVYARNMRPPLTKSHLSNAIRKADALGALSRRGQPV